MNRNMFLSYSRTDRDELPRLLKGLERLHHRVWMDDQLEGGQQWWDEVLRQLRACDALLVGVSPAMLESEACLSELAYAQDLGKPVLPVMLARVNPDLLPPRLAPLQVIDFTSANTQAPFDLMAALQGLPEAPALPDPLPDPPAVPMSYAVSLSEILHRSSLSLEEQHSVVRQLRAGLRRPRDREAAVALINRFAEREDLYASPARELDELRVEAANLPPVGPAAKPGESGGAEAAAPAAGAAAAGAAAGAGATSGSGAAPSPAGPGPRPAPGASSAASSAAAPANAWPPPSPPPPPPQKKSRRTAIIVGIAAVIALAGGGAVVASMGADNTNPYTFVPGPSGSSSEDSSEPAPEPAVGDACLVGGWRSTRLSLTNDGGTVEGGQGVVLTITEDGDATYDFSEMEPLSATIEGNDVKLEISGTIETRLHIAEDGSADESVVSDSSQVQSYLNGEPVGTPESGASDFQSAFSDYACDGTSLKLGTESDGMNFERQ